MMLEDEARKLPARRPDSRGWRGSELHRHHPGALRVEPVAGQAARRHRGQADGGARAPSARAQSGAAPVHVATDDERIAAAVRAHGCDAVMTRADQPPAPTASPRPRRRSSSRRRDRGQRPGRRAADRARPRSGAWRAPSTATAASVSTACHPIHDADELLNPNVGQGRARRRRATRSISAARRFRTRATRSRAGSRADGPARRAAGLPPCRHLRLPRRVPEARTRGTRRPDRAHRGPGAAAGAVARLPHCRGRGRARPRRPASTRRRISSPSAVSSRASPFDRCRSAIVATLRAQRTRTPCD